MGTICIDMFITLDGVSVWSTSAPGTPSQASTSARGSGALRHRAELR